jgi:type II secretory pathway component PulM
MNKLLDSVRESWDKLSERERKLLSMMASVAGLLLVFVAVWASSSAVADVEDERDQIRKVLSEISRSSDLLAKRDAERMALEARFQNRPPALAAFLESKAKDEGLEARQVVEQPEKDVSGYRRQNVRIHFSGVSLRPIMRFLSSIESESMPLAIERVLIEHYQQGDTYKVEIGVIAFEERKKSAGESKADEEPKP